VAKKNQPTKMVVDIKTLLKKFDNHMATDDTSEVVSTGEIISHAKPKKNQP